MYHISFQSSFIKKKGLLLVDDLVELLHEVKQVDALDSLFLSLALPVQPNHALQRQFKLVHILFLRWNGSMTENFTRVVQNILYLFVVSVVFTVHVGELCIDLH
jgi:hypothetical protein